MEMSEPDSLVLIDTSVWIDFFRKKAKVYESVDALIDQGKVCCLKLIIAELLQGARTEKELEVLRQLPSVFPLLPESPDSWEQAGLLSFRMRKAGKSIGLSDCYIAVVAQQNNALIYTHDTHFQEIRRHHDIKLFRQ